MKQNGTNEVSGPALPSSRPAWIGYAIAIGGTGLVLLLRWLLDDVFGSRAPLMFFSVSTLVATWYGGYKPGLVALLLGFVTGTFFFMEPRGTFLLSGLANNISAFSYVAATTPVIAAIEALHRTQRRLEREVDERKKTIELMTRADLALAQAAEQQKKLSHQLFESQETERRRIARELHDQAGQSLSLVQLHLQALRMEAGKNGLAQKLDECSRIVEQVIEQVQKLSLDLRPTMLDDLGLIPALRWYINQARAIGLNAIFMSQPKEMRLDPMLETTCYRIVQEALSNVIRHARAKWVYVDLRQSKGDLLVTISDNGVGFDPGAVRQKGGENPCLGLLGMEERAGLVGGQITFQSIPDHGTEVHVRFPLQSKEMLVKG